MLMLRRMLVVWVSAEEGPLASVIRCVVRCWTIGRTARTLLALLEPESVSMMLLLAITLRLLRSVLFGRMKNEGALAEVSAVVTPWLMRLDPFTLAIMMWLW